MNSFLVVLFRWLHIVPACLAVGGVFFMRIVLPVGLTVLEPEQRQAVFLRCRRVFKMVIHSSILLLLVSGTYNILVNRSAYHRAMPASHAVLGLHVILAFVVFVISVVLLASKDLPPSHKRWMTVNLAILMFVLLAGGILKYVRDHAPPPPSLSSSSSSSSSSTAQVTP